MKSLAGTKTEQNLLKSFAGEYEFFAKVAKNEGFEQIAAIFIETANQEKQHAKRFFKFLEGREVEITATYPAGKIGTTAENLLAAAMGENEEWTDLYPHFAEVAKEEGFNEIAAAFKMIAKVEAEHEKRFKKLLQNVEDGTVFKKGQKVKWACRNCGYVHEGEEALDMCPACQHPKSHFEIYPENY